MSELGDDFRALREFNQERRAENRAAAEMEYEEARRVAGENDLLLSQISEVHYQLQPQSHPDQWLINVYPGNERIYADRQRSRAPYLRVSRPWTLLDVVTAAIRAMNRGRKS